MAQSNARAEFEIGLKDDTGSGVASSVGNLKKAEASLKGVAKEYNATKAAMANLQKGQVVDIELHRKLDEKQKALGSRLAGLQGYITKQKDALGQHAHVGDSASKATDKFGATLRAASGSLGSMGSHLREQHAQFGAFGVGVLATVAALTALAAVTLRAAKSLVSLALSSADARRSELLHFEAITKIRNIWGVMGGSAKVMQDAVDSVADKTALSRDELVKYADQLQRTGFRGANLKQALEGVAITAQTQGDTWAQAFIGMASQTVYFGGSVKRMTDDVKARLGGIAAKQLLSLPNILAKLRTNVSNLFRDVKIEGFLAALKKFTDLLSLNTATGAALKQILSTLFSVFFGQASKAEPAMQAFVEGAVLGLQRITIWLLQIAIRFKKAFGPSGDHNNFLTWANAGKVAVYGLAYAFVGLAIGIAAIGALIGVFIAQLANLVKVIVKPFVLAYEAIQFVKKAWQDASGDWAQFGINIVTGIADGIKTGAGIVLEAIKGLARGAKATFKAVFGIASPSKWARTESRWIPAGVAVGIRDGIPHVRAAMNDVGAAAGVGFGVGGAPPIMAGASRAGHSAVINVTVNMSGGGSTADVEAAAKRGAEAALEAWALEIGAAA